MEEEYYYCGKCGSEVHENDNFCKGCGADLNEAENEEIKIEEAEEEITKPGSLDQNRTVVLKKYTDDVSAEMAKQVLSEEGISAIVSKDDAGGMTPNLQFNSRIRLLVLSKDLQRAKEILNIDGTKKKFDSFNSDMLRGVKTVIYHVDSIDRGKEWYSRALEMNPFFDKPFYVGFDIGGFELGLKPGADDISVNNKGQIAYWGVTDIEVVFKHLLLIGAQRQEDIKDIGGGVLTASVADPFGNIIGLIQVTQL